MKKLVVLLFLIGCFTEAHAVYWGALHDYVKVKQSVQRGESTQPYLIDEILRGGSVRVYLTGNINLQQERLYEELIDQAYNSWFLQTAQFIHKANRQEEFKDILPLLEKGIPVVFVQEEKEANMFFYVWPQWVIKQASGGDTVAYYTRKDVPIPSIYMPLELKKRDKLLRVLTHEIGHSLGLADQYTRNGGRQNADARYSTPTTGKAMMSNLKFTCDDVDGIINLIDLSRQKFHGGVEGWKSFCKKPGYRYVRGIVPGKVPYFISAVGDGNAWEVVRIDQKEEQRWTFLPDMEASYSVFEEHPFTVTERDKKGRPVRAKGQKGETIYYMYSYDLVRRLVVRGEKALLDESNFNIKQGERIISFAGGDGGFHKILIQKKRKGKKEISYVTGVGNPQDEGYGVLLVVSAKGKLLSEQWEGEYPGKDVGLAAFTKYYETSGSKAGAESQTAIAGQEYGDPGGRSAMGDRIKRSQEEAARNTLRNRLIKLAFQQ